MDPNALLTSIRLLVKDWEAGRIGNQDFSEAMVDQFDDLDHWLTGGGFLPDAWQQHDDYRLRAL